MAVQGTPGLGGTACSGRAPSAGGDGDAHGRLWGPRSCAV